MSCSSTIWPSVSAAAGSVSFITSFIAQIPQLIETYKDKTVEGLSPIFLLAWLFGDITSLIGALLTHQLPFQIILALYFMANDMFICGQYYYYGILHQNKLATPGHESKISAERIATISSRGSLNRGLKKKSWLASLFVFGNSAHGFPILMSYMTKASFRRQYTTTSSTSSLFFWRWYCFILGWCYVLRVCAYPSIDQKLQAEIH